MRLSAASTLLLSALLALPSMAQEARVQLEGCEFSVRLPDPPTLRQGGPPPPDSPAAGPRQTAQLRDQIPAYEVECQPMRFIPPGAERVLLNDMQRRAQSMNLRDVEVSSDPDRLGRIGRFSGVDVQAGREFMVTGVYYLGRASLFSVIASEPVRGYPAEAVQRVLGSVSR